MSANTRLDSLSDLINHNANLKITCRCGRVHVLDAKRLWRYTLLRCWNSQLEALQTRLKCSACGRTNCRLRASPEPPTPSDPFPRTEDEWKRLQRRLRG